MATLLLRSRRTGPGYSHVISMINIYINERSIVGQYCNDFGERISKVIQNVRILQANVLGGVTVYVARSIYDYVVCNAGQVNFSTFLSKNKEQKKQFQLMLQKATIKDIPFNNNDIYSYGELFVDNSSMSVAYEEKVPGANKQLLLNFGVDLFPDGNLLIEKNLADGREVHATFETNQIGEWLRTENILGVYTPDTPVKTIDEQTILCDTALFSPTNHYVQGRRVYKRNGKPEYWYADNGHRGGSAHLEVFQSSDMHFKGTCHIDDINTFVLASKKKRGERTISFD